MFVHFFLIAIVVLAFILYPYLCTTSHNLIVVPKEDIIREKQEELEKMVSIIVNHIQLERAFSTIDGSSVENSSLPFILPSYSVISSETVAHIDENSIIHLVFWDNDCDRLYEDNTLRHMILRGIAHIMAKDNWNVVKDIEGTLINTAIKLHYCDNALPISDTYPCRF